ncbi:MAG: prepilin-type N-terminal cleavage/methylation domain-containing protein [Planctomycetaceae bacterium]|nr:prepilin-type N-terminal cleavage/methylation domain-containing protein [Planctomycetaceae bacterium]
MASRQWGVDGRCPDRSHDNHRSTFDSRPSTIHPQPTTRRGFTLIEVLVALALTVVLLSAVYASINVSYQLSTAGREQMEQAQLVRALFRTIESDIRSVVFVIQEDATQTDEAAAEEDVEVVIEKASPDEAFANESSGVFGDSQSLVLHISRPSRIVGQTTDSPTSHSDLAAVNYFLAVRGASGLAGQVAQAAYDGSLLDAPRAGTVTGLTRLEGDRLLVQHASETGDLETLSTHARILAPEVVSLNFAYWNGLEWTDSWDTIVEGQPPSAIAITLGIVTAEQDIDGVGAKSFSDHIRTTSRVNDVLPKTYRHVVTLPNAQPFAGELVQ